MKETDFIELNQEKWVKLEAQLKAKKRSRDYNRIGESFVQLSEDLSYSQTYYPRRTVRVYLNALAQNLYKKVFNARISDKKARFNFWRNDLPTALWESRKELSIALIFFCLAAFVGVVSSKYEGGFASQILGSSYVNMTEENIKNGDPMGVYKGMDAVPMFFKILYNNLQVSTYTFILGILFGVGTLGIIFRNGVMLGVFQYFFFQHGIGFESFLTIWQHGTIEIASIVVAGGAGLVLGRSIVFPGSLPRMVSLKFGFLKGLKVLLGVAPLIVLAAFIESFYTRFDELPMAFRISTILASLGFVLGYYIYLPIKRGRKNSLIEKVSEIHIDPQNSDNIYLKKIKSIGEIFSDSLFLIQNSLSSFIRSGALPAVLLGLVVVTVLRDSFLSYFYFAPLSGFLPEQLTTTFGEVISRLEMIEQLFSLEDIWLWPLLSLIMFWVSNTSVKTFISSLKIEPSKVNNLSNNAFLILIHAIALSGFFASTYYSLIYFLVVIPILSVAWFVVLTENTNIADAFFNSIKIILFKPFRHAGMLLITALFSLLATALVQSPVFFLLFELGNDFIGFSESNAHYIIEFAIVFVSLFTLFCSLVFLTFNSIFSYLSVNEIKNATELINEINSSKTLNA